MGGNIPGVNFLGGNFPGGVWWVGIFPGVGFLKPMHICIKQHSSNTAAHLKCIKDTE